MRRGFVHEALTRKRIVCQLILMVAGLFFALSVSLLLLNIMVGWYSSHDMKVLIGIWMAVMLPGAFGTVIDLHQEPHTMERPRNLRGRPFFCHQCAYDLRRSNRPTCPECDWEIEIKPKQPRERWRVIRGRRMVRYLLVGGMVVSLVACGWVVWLVVAAR